MSQERPAALETAPKGWRPRSAAPWRARVGAGGSGNGHREGPPEGTGLTPTLGRRRVTPPPARSGGRSPPNPRLPILEAPARPSAGRPGPAADGALSRPGGGRGWGSGWAAACPRADSASAPQEQSAPRASGRAGKQHSPRTRWPGRGARKPLRPGPAGAERPLQSASRGAGAAAVLGGQGSDAAAAPFSRPGPCSAASSPSPGPRRRLSLGAARAAPLHQGRAGPRGTSRKVRAGGRLPQLLVAIFNPPPPPALPTSRAG